ncbi:MAG: YjjG family noncanonical pyrimidine nucleotidase [Melioribacteraceae bacterium]|nr:YjjG family noncanonical pyrimidine nucleotidase [Melioribacteraceae bacterium]
MKYELLIFDADDTLFNYNEGESFALAASLQAFKINADFNNFRKTYSDINKSLWQDFELNQISADDLKIERFRRLFSSLNIGIDAEKFSDLYLHNLSKAVFLIDGALELIKKLSRNYRLVIITNGLTKVQRPRFNKSAIGKYFETYIISEEIGLQKPDPGIFKFTFNKTKYNKKDKTLMIGDNLGSDILGGNLFGIDTCWYNPGQKANLTGITPTFEIHRLSALLTLLK